ncbi:MAG TPA: hypothetical protein VFF68_03735 [Anaerolineaceae bacterium]|nr:hypothetical protein [Anaerolineaceae bacterium]
MGEPINLSPFGWTVLICLGVFILLINVSLFAALRRKKTTPPRIDPMRFVPKDIGKTLRDPWHQEDAQWRELSQQVAQLKRDQPPRPDDSDPENRVE